MEMSPCTGMPAHVADSKMSPLEETFFALVDYHAIREEKLSYIPIFELMYLFSLLCT